MKPEKFKDLTPEQLAVVSALTNLNMKVNVTWSFIGVFVTLTIALIVILLTDLGQNNASVKIAVTAVDGFVGWIGKALVAHYLPALGQALKAPRKNSQ